MGTARADPCFKFNLLVLLIPKTLVSSPIPQNLDGWEDVEALNLCYAGVKSLQQIIHLQNLRNRLEKK